METIEDLRTQVINLKKTIKDLAGQIDYYKDARSADVAAAAQIVQGRIQEQLPIRKSADGRVELLRQHLRQELAYIIYLEECLHKAGIEILDFNSVPKDKRETYFKNVDAQIGGVSPDPGRFTDPYEH